MENVSLDEQEIRNVLSYLHGEARKDFWQYSKFGFLIFRDLFTGNKKIFSRDPGTRSHAFRKIYIGWRTRREIPLFDGKVNPCNKYHRIRDFRCWLVTKPLATDIARSIQCQNSDNFRGLSEKDFPLRDQQVCVNK